MLRSPVTDMFCTINVMFHCIYFEVFIRQDGSGPGAALVLVQLWSRCSSGPGAALDPVQLWSRCSSGPGAALDPVQL